MEGLTVADIVRMVEDFAPPALAEDWDPAGLQAGHPQWRAGDLLLALDVTLEVVREAASLGCGMIIAHHPILFRGIRSLREDRPDGALATALVRERIALYTAHTSLDNAQGGVMDEMCARIGLSRVSAAESCRMAAFDGGDLGALRDRAIDGLGLAGATVYGHPRSPVRDVALCSGSGMSYLKEIRDVDALITGDVTHHDALDALAAGIAVLDVGHRAGELVATDLLKRGLQNRMIGVEYPSRVRVSSVDPYAIVTGKP